MSLIQWTKELSVNIGSIDEQHRKLVDLVNALHDQMLKGKANDALSQALKELTQYTKEHFAFEERVMAEHGYPALPEHRSAHEALTGRVVEFERGFAERKAFLSQNLMFFLRDWLKSHIQGADKQYGPFLNGKGVL